MKEVIYIFHSKVAPHTLAENVLSFFLRHSFVISKPPKHDLSHFHNEPPTVKKS